MIEPRVDGHSPGFPIVVQKFGGTSVRDAEAVRRAADHILRAVGEGNRVVVVVSAPGDMTDRLLERALELNPRPDPRELDVLLATGEQISIALMAMALEAKGQPASSLTGSQAGIRTDRVHGDARILGIDPQRVLEGLRAGRVVVVAGFQGVDEAMDVTTLGRGGSDLTAVALAAVLKARACEVYTDVEGVFTADPRVVPEAKKLTVVSHAEMLEMASLGARVMQARSVEYALRLGVDLHVRSTFSDGMGTWIRREPYMEGVPVVTGITCDPNAAKITVVGVPDRPGIAHHLFTAVAERNVNVDLIIQGATRAGKADVTFTVAESDLDAALEAAREVADALGAEGLEHSANLAKVSVVGAGMMNTPGVAARIFGVLGEAGINIQLVGCSEIKVSCVVDRDRADDATRALHRAFDLFR